MGESFDRDNFSASVIGGVLSLLVVCVAFSTQSCEKSRDIRYVELAKHRVECVKACMAADVQLVGDHVVRSCLDGCNLSCRKK